MKLPRDLMLLSIAVLFGGAAFLACTDSGSSFIGPDESVESSISGLALLKNGAEILEVKGTSVRGQVSIKNGLNGDIYEVEFRDDNEEVVDLVGDNYGLCCNFENDACAGMERNDDLARFQFNLCGHRKGETKFNVILVKESKEIYKSAAIPLEVR